MVSEEIAPVPLLPEATFEEIVDELKSRYQAVIVARLDPVPTGGERLEVSSQGSHYTILGILASIKVDLENSLSVSQEDE